MMKKSLRQRLVPFALLIAVALLMFLAPLHAEDNFEAIKREMAQMKKEGRHEDALRLQANLKQQIDLKFREQMMSVPKVEGSSMKSSSRHNEIRDRQRSRKHDSRLDSILDERLGDRFSDHTSRRRDSRERRSLGPAMTAEERTNLMKGLSDERAIYHMEQSHRKSGILHHKLSKGEGTFHQEELSNYRDLIEQYLQLEKVVATFLQKTSEDYEKARSIGDRDTRKEYLESVKAAWDLRKPQEKAARDAARDAFLHIKHILEGHLEAHTEL